MNADEAIVLLLKVNSRDKFPRWRTEQVLAFDAREWAEDLADVPLDVAIDAMRAHYALTREPLTIADIREFVPVHNSSWAGDITAQRLAAEAAGQRALEPGDD